MKKLRIAVIGMGRLGTFHASNYRQFEEVELVGLCDTNELARKNASEKFNLPVFQDHKELFGKADAVSITVPTKLHYKITKDFLNQGIHTLIEKPITTTLKQADELIKIATKKNLILQVGHIERFNSAFHSTAHLIKNPKFIETHRLSPFPNRSLDVGAVLDIMIHDIDIIFGLVQSPIKSIDAVGINVLTDKEDIANARIKFKNGCVCNLTASRVSDEYMRKVRIFQENSYISLDYNKQEAFIYRKVGSAITKEAIPIEKEEPLKEELNSFIDCVLANKKPVVSGIEARSALKVALEIQNKIWRKKIF